MDRLKTEKRTGLALACFNLVLAAFLCRRWWMLFYSVCTGLVFSDVPLHIELALGHNDYGLSSLLIQLFYLGGESFAQRALALSLTVNNFIGLFTVALLIRFLLPRLGAFSEIPVPGVHRLPLHRQVSPADVRRGGQELLC